MVINGYSTLPTLQHYWSLTIILLSFISRTLVAESYPFALKQSVYSAAPTDWAMTYSLQQVSLTPSFQLRVHSISGKQEALGLFLYLFVFPVRYLAPRLFKVMRSLRINPFLTGWSTRLVVSGVNCFLFFRFLLHTARIHLHMYICNHALSNVHLDTCTHKSNTILLRQRCIVLVDTEFSHGQLCERSK